MNSFLTWFLATRTAPAEISFLNIWHILYLLGAVGGTFLFAYLIRNKSAAFKKNYLDALAYTLVILYVSDFFLNPFYRDSFTMDMDKLPFHICTVLCPIVAFVQCNTRFRKFFDRIKEGVVLLAIVAPMMYLVYPGAAIGDISAFCYKVVQTFIYHGVLFAWGVLNITTGQIKPHIKRCWHPLIGLVLVAVWASLGNAAYLDYDWFFISGSMFGFLVEPHLWLLPPLVVTAIFCVTLCVYGIYHLCAHVYKTKIAKVTEVAPEPTTVEDKIPANV